MPASRTFAVDNIGAPEPVVVQSVCRRIWIREQGAADGSAAQQYNVRIPFSTSPAVAKAAGEPHEFLAPYPSEFFAPGITIAFVETLTAATTFVQIED